MATHSSILAWRIPRTEEPGGLQSIGLQRAGHDQSDLACMDPCHTDFFFLKFKLFILCWDVVDELIPEWLRW